MRCHCRVSSVKVSRNKWQAPAAYDSSVATTNPLAVYLLSSTFDPLDVNVKEHVITSTERDLNDGLRKLQGKRKLSANEKKVLAEKTVQEMIQIYLAVEDRGFTLYCHEKAMYNETSFLCQIIQFAAKYKIKAARYVEYAVGECMMCNPNFYTSHYFLKCLFYYTHKCKMDEMT